MVAATALPSIASTAFAVTALLTSLWVVSSKLCVGDEDSFVAHFSLLTICLAAFILSSVCVESFEPTRHLGRILLDRNLNFVSNWNKETLRSTIESIVWISTISKSYEHTMRLDFACVTGSISAMLVVFLGELLTPVSRSLETSVRRHFGQENAKDSQSLASSSSFMVILYGYAGLTKLLAHVKDVTLAVALSAGCGLSLLVASKVIHSVPFTRHCGEILQDRFYSCSTNWVKHPMRSAAELSIFLAITTASYAQSQDPYFSVQCSVICGILVCLGGEASSRFMPSTKTHLVPTAVVVYAIVLTCHYIFTDIPSLIGRQISFGAQLALSVLTALSYVTMGHILSSFQSTAKLGTLIHDRLRQTRRNWEIFPVRSSVEVGTTNVFTWAIWYVTGSLLLTFGAALIAGPSIIVLNEYVLSPFQYDRTSGVVPPSSLTKSAAPEAPEAKQAEAGPAEAKLRPRVRPRDNVLTMSEIKGHSEVASPWLVIDNEVYDVTEFAKMHPGGTIIYKYAGKDCTDQFKAFHRPRVSLYLKKYHIGTLKESDRPVPDEATLAYRELRAKLWKDGHFEANAAYYNIKHAVWVSFILMSLAAVSLSTSMSVRTLFGGACLGLGLQQAAFLAHDAAHNGILPPKKGGINWLAWFLGSVVFGISTNMWTEEHSMHHAITVRPREDPQFNYLPIWLIDLKELANPKVDGPSGYRLNPFIRFLVRLQHFHFLPLVIIVGRVNLHAISVGYELKNMVLGRAKPALVGLLGMALYWTWHASLVSLLPSAREMVIFSVVSHVTAGILHIQLLLSHMDVNTHTEEEEDAAGFFKHQCEVSRNIEVAWYENWFHGGLEYQIEHHLFPQLPRHQLHVVKPMVENLCKEHGVIYRSDTFTEAVGGVLGSLRELAWAVVSLEQ
mmetsp:Transcript_24209/g.50293  ORF Transcript_24209/g.50293 Transcript_24209/m.50293 type:complete len:899 (-) Transcript_24209:863-3559(-)